MHRIKHIASGSATQTAVTYHSEEMEHMRFSIFIYLFLFDSHVICAEPGKS